MEKLVLYRVGWSSNRNEAFYTIRHPPVPAIIKYWCTGHSDTTDHYVGFVAVPEGMDPMDVIRQEFYGVVDRQMTIPYSEATLNDRFPMSGGDWDTQRMAYFMATGQLYTGPIVGLYESAPTGQNWWCTTNVEIFDV